MNYRLSLRPVRLGSIPEVAFFKADQKIDRPAVQIRLGFACHIKITGQQGSLPPPDRLCQNLLQIAQAWMLRDHVPRWSAFASYANARGSSPLAAPTKVRLAVAPSRVIAESFLPRLQQPRDHFLVGTTLLLFARTPRYASAPRPARTGGWLPG